MAKRKARPQTTAELRKEVRGYVNPLIARANRHSEQFCSLGEAVNRNADILESVQKRLECVSADRMATQIDLEAEQRRIDKLAVVDEVLAARIERIGKQFDGLLDEITARRAAAAVEFSTFRARLRWLLTGK